MVVDLIPSDYGTTPSPVDRLEHSYTFGAGHASTAQSKQDRRYSTCADRTLSPNWAVFKNELSPLITAKSTPKNHRSCRNGHLLHSPHITIDIPDSDTSDHEPPKKFRHARYAATKSSAQAITNFALITSNATQLKGVIDAGPGVHNYYYFFLVTLSASIALQVVIGFLLIWLVSRETKLGDFMDKGARKTKKWGKAVIAAVFAVSITNMIMNAFAVKMRWI